MKKIITLTAISFGLLLGLPACKKGENDPFFSTKSRKARLTGEWQLESSEATETYNGEVVSTSKLENGTFTEIEGTDTISYEQEVTLKFEKDGSFVRTIKENYDDYEIDNVHKGIWNFLDKNEPLDMKDEECISLAFKESVRSAYQNGTLYSTYTETYDVLDKVIRYIDRLSNKELHLIDKETSIGDDGTEITYFQTRIFKKL